jgi:HAD superfamily hydrolase (TIGR01509 family)
MHRQMRFPNIIFDFDGTLSDSRKDIADAQLWALRNVGIDGFCEEDIFPLIGKPLQVTFERLLPPEQHEKIPRAIALYSEYYPPRSLVTTRLFPGVRETLHALKTNGHHLAVASTKKGPGILRVTEHFGITTYFDRLQGSEDMNYKPAPDVIFAVLRAQGWAANDTIMVGDTDADILAGQAAGIATCAVTYGALAAAELAALDPDNIIHSITALPAIVGAP